jgi:4-amino-4-deoxy-L-arabinose transferase-like glycosyltransferase
MNGEALFNPVFSASPPVFIEILSFNLSIFGDSVVVGRLTVLAFAIVSLASVAWIAWRLYTPSAAPVAALFLGVSLIFFREARIVYCEMPALAFALLSLALLWESIRASNRWCNIAAGVCFSLGMLCKFTVFPYLVPALFIMACSIDAQGTNGFGIVRLAPLKQTLKHAMLFTLGSVVTLAILLRYDLNAFYDQAIRFHLDAETAFRNEGSINLDLLVDLFRIELGLTAAAVAGVIALARRHRLTSAYLLIWVAAAIGFCWKHTPLQFHHTVILFPPLALSAACLVPFAAGLSQPAWRLVAVVTAILLPISIGASAIKLTVAPVWFVQRDVGEILDLEPTPADEVDAMAMIQQLAKPDQYVISDQPMQVFRSGRNTSPELCDTSFTRIRSGYLSDEQAIEGSRNAQVVILWTGRLESLPLFTKWVEGNFTLVRRFESPDGFRREVYERKDVP